MVICASHPKLHMRLRWGGLSSPAQAKKVHEIPISTTKLGLVAHTCHLSYRGKHKIGVF
jgi:hypothetical protein